MEAKLVLKLAGIFHNPIVQVFLDVQISYKPLDWKVCMEVLKG